MKELYIDAVLQMIKEGKEFSGIIDGLQKIMQQKGHTSLLAPVLRGVLRVLQTEKTTGTVIYIAKEADREKLAARITTTLAAINAENDEPTFVVDETLIGGVLAKRNNVVIDRSYKTALINLYRSVTK